MSSMDNKTYDLLKHVYKGPTNFSSEDVERFIDEFTLKNPLTGNDEEDYENAALHGYFQKGSYRITYSSEGIEKIEFHNKKVEPSTKYIDFYTYDANLFYFCKEDTANICFAFEDYFRRGVHAIYYTRKGIFKIERMTVEVNKEGSSDEEQELFEVAVEEFREEAEKLKFRIDELIDSIIAYAEDFFRDKIYERIYVNMEKDETNKELIDNIIEETEDALCFSELKETERLTNTYRGFLEKMKTS